MKNKINVSISVFEQNFKMAKHAYVLNSSMEACGCASAFIGCTEPADEERFLRAKKTVKQNTGVLSVLGRGNAKQVLAAAIAAAPDPDSAMSQISMIHTKLDKKFLNSDYLVLSAIMIYKNCEPSEYDSVIERTREIYKLIRKDHPLITGREDLPNCTLMALSGMEPSVIANRCEADFKALRKHYVMKNNIQYLACMLSIFDGEPEERAFLAKKTQKDLRAHGVRFDSYGLPIIGAISAIVEQKDMELVCDTIRHVSDELKSIRGMGSLGAGKRIRNMIATAIVLDAYTEEESPKVRSSVSAAIISLTGSVPSPIRL